MEVPNTNSEIELQLTEAGATWRSGIKPALENAISELQDDLSLVLYLSYISRISDDEIALVMEMGEGSSSVHDLRQKAIQELATGKIGEYFDVKAIRLLLDQYAEDRAIASEHALSDSHVSEAVKGIQSVSEPQMVKSETDKPFPPKQSPFNSLFNWSFFSLFDSNFSLAIPVAVCILLVSTYGILWVGGRVLLSETYEIASVDDHTSRLQRGDRNVDVDDTPFQQGALLLIDAKVSFLGLFPKYDKEIALEAALRFNTAYESTSDPFQRAEIAFFSAKAYLMAEDIENARLWLNRVTEQDAVTSFHEEANIILDVLDQ